MCVKTIQTAIFLDLSLTQEILLVMDRLDRQGQMLLL
jgi:hypothetical protein